MKDLARWLMTIGGFTFVVGVVLAVFGRLPGDLVIARGGLRVYLPLGTCLLLSIAFSFLAWLLRR